MLIEGELLENVSEGSHFVKEYIFKKSSILNEQFWENVSEG